MTTTIRFEDFTLDPEAFELRRAGEVVALEPQAFDVLVVLVRNADRVVPKAELLDQVWGSRFVSESALTTRIKQVRHALGDDGRSQRLVRTLHGRGYRFVGPVSPSGAPAATSGPSPLALLERSAPLDLLAASLARARESGHGRVVLVAGEAGLGKSSLVKAFTASVDAEVLLGGCDDLLSPRVLGPVRDMARGRGGPMGAAWADGNPDAMLSAVLETLSTSPTVMVIEDLHWADDATLDLVRLVARRIDELPSLLVLTYRDQLAPDHPLWRLLGALGGPLVERIELEPLSRAAVEQLASAAEREAASLYEVTRGNPFYVTEVLASDDRSVPATVRDAVLSRLSGLSPDGRDLVSAISVVPTRAERWLVEAVAADRDGALAETERAGVLTVDVEHVWFRHELARRAVEELLPAAERIRLNRRVLDALVARVGVEPSRLVHHAREAGEVDRMLDYAAVAADDAIRLRAYRQTIAFLDLLLEHQDRMSTTNEVAASTRRAYALYVLNRLEESVAVADAAVELAERSDDGDGLVDALLIGSRAAYWTHGPATARANIERAIEQLSGSGSDALLSAAYADLARSLSNLVNVGIVAEPDPRVVDAAERSLEIADRLERPDLQSHALQYLGTGRLALGDDRGAADLARAVELAEVEPRDELPVRACVNAAGGFFRAGRLDEAERFVRLGLERTAGGEFFAGAYRLELTRAGVLVAGGKWDAAGELLCDLVERPGEPGIMRPLARSMLARILARRGEHEAASGTVAAAIASTRGLRDIQIVGPVAVAALEVAWLAGSTPPPLVGPAVELALDAGHRVSLAELAAYSERAGASVEAPVDAPGPWAPTLAGDEQQAARAWFALGDRYEGAVVLARSPVPARRDEGRELLSALGATATLAAVG